MSALQLFPKVFVRGPFGVSALFLQQRLVPGRVRRGRFQRARLVAASRLPPQIPLEHFTGLGLDLVLFAVLRRAPFLGIFAPQRRIGHHHVRPGAALFHQRDVIAPDVAHDEVVRHAFMLAGREVGIVAVCAGKLAERAIFNGVNGRAVPDGQGRVDVRGVPDRAGPHGPHAGQLAGLVRAVDVVLDVQGQTFPCPERLLQFARVSQAVINLLRIKPGRLPAGDFPAVVRVHRGLCDVR